MQRYDTELLWFSVLTHTHGNTQISEASDQDGQQGTFGDGCLGILEKHS